jgi:hypothetical protein
MGAPVGYLDLYLQVKYHSNPLPAPVQVTFKWGYPLPTGKPAGNTGTHTLTGTHRLP